MGSTGHDNELEHLLDRALATYSAQQPRPGLEGRIMRRINDPDGNWTRSLPWCVALASVFGAVVLAMVLLRPSRQITSASDRIAVVSGAPRINDPRENRTEHVSKRGPGRAVRARVVRKSVAREPASSAPAPLTTEEAALVRLAVVAPEVLRDAAAAHHQQSQPVTIQPITIPPLGFGGDSMEE